MSCILYCNSSAIAHNVRFLSNLIHKRNGYLFGVTKVLSGSPELAFLFIENGCDGIADSRWQNLKKIKESNIFRQTINKYKDIPFLNLRLPALSELEQIVKYSEISLVSELQVIKAINDESKKQDKKTGIILMIDLGDLREGIIPENAKELDIDKYKIVLHSYIKEIRKLSYIDFMGIGTNLACFGGIVPSEENMNLLVNLSKWISSEYGLKLKYISGSNSSGIPFLLENKMPLEINHFRIGESMILGVNVLNREPIEGLRQDTVKLSVEVIEKKFKPSKPIGKNAQNAFGEILEFEDKGTILRLICSAGRQDINLDGLKALDKDISILGASSDHLELQLTNNFDKYDLGSFVNFQLSYGALLAASTSNYVEVKFI
ncbi:MAG: alanine/ornithine racemase family PLP-dependent enzyme [Exilispira sp.]